MLPGRMRTVRGSAVAVSSGGAMFARRVSAWGCLSREGVCPGRVSVQGGCLSREGVCPGRVSVQGECLPRGCLPGGVHQPPVNRIIDSCKNITFL